MEEPRFLLRYFFNFLLICVLYKTVSPGYKPVHIAEVPGQQALRYRHVQTSVLNFPQLAYLLACVDSQLQFLSISGYMLVYRPNQLACPVNFMNCVHIVTGRIYVQRIYLQ